MTGRSSPAAHKELDVATPDGRIVRAASFGPRDGIPVIWHHGNPGSRVGPVPETTLEAAGVRLIAYDHRPWTSVRG